MQSYKHNHKNYACLLSLLTCLELILGEVRKINDNKEFCYEIAVNAAILFELHLLSIIYSCGQE